ncbi:hypothetical protein I6N95_18760 [Vagococcus sp. BWB3-3]|uniref:Uncharacterized protein n=1 Tax=Vagococcus allomyrinae TaxID=2794353 RepID=A0A940SXA4_9ENTE|nr:hypothetical protein [Vagococcus allomyrinae]MBP1043061.1 hypothetical protein [Vagococcus allomyrinae]
MYVYFIHTSTTSILSRSIGVYTKNKYNHVSIGFDQELMEVYSFGRKQIHNPLVGGFVREDMSSGLFTDAKCQVYRMAVTTEEYYQMKALLQEFEGRRQALKYNFLGLIFLSWGFEIERPNHYFCSEFAATILKNSTNIILPKKVTFMTPQDMTSLPEMELIYEGAISSYLELNALAKFGYPVTWEVPSVAY